MAFNIQCNFKFMVYESNGNKRARPGVLKFNDQTNHNPTKEKKEKKTETKRTLIAKTVQK